MPKNNKSRGWILVINNPTEDDLKISQVLGGQKALQYACGELEVGEGGTRHIQAYIEWTGPRTFQTMHKLFPRAHLEPRLGSSKAARDYALKEGKWANDPTSVPDTKWEVGEFKETGNGRGARNDLQEVTEFLQSGGTVRECYLAYPAVCARYPRFVDRFANYVAPPRMWETKVIVYKGPTGCGKTRKAYEEYPTIWNKPVGSWYDTYDGQEYVLLDDFNGRDSGVEYPEFLRITDRYPLSTPFKGGFVNWRPKVIVITTNREPRDWYPCNDFAPLERRLTEVHRWPDN